MRAGRSTKFWEWGWTMADVGSAYVTLMPSMRGFANDIKAQFGQAGNEGGKSFGSGLTTGILGAAVPPSPPFPPSAGPPLRPGSSRLRASGR